MDAQNTPNQPQRRRRRPRRPAWVKNKFTYQLWRNWPMIRFVLLCILVLAILFGLGKCAVSAISGLFSGKDPVESTPGTSEPVQTTVPPETEPKPDELLRRADMMAAGYDYEGAAQLLSHHGCRARRHAEHRRQGLDSGHRARLPDHLHPALRPAAVL